MSRPRTLAKAVLLGQEVFISGGFNIIEHEKQALPTNMTVHTFSDFELISKNRGKKLNISLPLNPQDNSKSELYAHMMIPINETFSMLIGGITEQSWNYTDDITVHKTSVKRDLFKDSLEKEGTNLTFYYDHDNQKWTQGPEMMHPRYLGSVAGILIDKVTGEEIIAVYTDGAKFFDWSIIGLLREYNVNHTTNHTVSGEFLKKGSKNWIPGMYTRYLFGFLHRNNEIEVFLF